MFGWECCEQFIEAGLYGVHSLGRHVGRFEFQGDSGPALKDDISEIEARGRQLEELGPRSAAVSVTILVLAWCF